MVVRIIILVSALLIHQPALGQQLPGEADLKSAYCIRVIQYQLSILGSGSLEGYSPDIQRLILDERESTSSRLRRLQLYLVPRIPHLDSGGIAAAMKAGDEDVARANQRADSCVAECQGKPSTCMADCSKSMPENTARMARCSDLSWLPF
jgi:hypothetical protein